MVLSQSERISQLLDNSRKYVSRNKVRDSSELTLIHQAKASSSTVPAIVKGLADPHTSQLVPNYQYANDCAAVTYFTGVGTKDQTALLYNKQKCAICADDDPAVNPYIILPTPNCANVIVPVVIPTGGSLFFDLAYLSTENTEDFRLDSSYPDFTIEWFQYSLPEAYGTTQRVLSIGDNTNEAFTFYGTYNQDTLNGDYVEVQYTINNNDLYHTGLLASDVLNKWVHFAIERVSGYTNIYLNGVSFAGINDSYTVTDSSNPLIIGAKWDYTENFNGYLTNFRWTKGVAVYNGNFTVPTTPLTASSPTVLLLSVATPDTATKDTAGYENVFTNSSVVYDTQTPF